MNRREWLATLAVAGTAGCLRLSSNGGEDSATPTPIDPGGTATAAPTSTPTAPRTEPPDATETAADVSADDYPTGLSDDGVSMLLLDKHVNELAGTPYTVNHRLRDVGDSSLRTDERLAVEGRFARFEQRSAELDLFIEITSSWYDPVVWRTTGTRTPLYGDLEICCLGNATALAYAKRGHGGSLQYLFWALKGGDYGAPTPTEGGDAFEISADAVGDPSPVLNRFDADRVERFAAEGTVTAAGVVRDLAVTVEYVRGDRLTQLEAEFALTEIGSTTVSTPSWTETARERAPDLSVSMRDDRLGVEYVHDGGDPIPADAHVSLHGHVDTELASGPERSRLTEPFEAGQTVIAYLADDRVNHARGSLPGDADPVELPDEGYTTFDAPASMSYFKKNFQDLG